MSVERLKQISPNINGLYHIQLSTQTVSVKSQSSRGLMHPSNTTSMYINIHYKGHKCVQKLEEIINYYYEMFTFYVLHCTTSAGGENAGSRHSVFMKVYI